MDLDSIYASHPLSRATILARLARQGIPSGALTEWHLAIDPDTDITDQNHVGGVQAVLELASAAAITPTSTVLDIGAGLGGSARVLAAAIGCRVIALEADRGRTVDATALTAMVHLEHRVSVRELDALQADAVTGFSGIDVLWGQSAWVHFPSPELFLSAWLPVLADRGRVAMADSYLARKPRTDAEHTLLRDLEASWGACLSELDRWIQHLERCQLHVTHRSDDTAESRLHLRRLEEVSERWPPGMRTELEATGWRNAIAAFDSGLIRSERLVASR